MSSEVKFEIGHVLFLDLVGYSKLLLDEQKERLRELTEIVLATSQVKQATGEELVRLPTGDGMALVFRRSSEEPVQCALEIAQALKTHPQILLRMGIHSGPVSEVQDVSGRTNIAGTGINLAQRVMDCGDAGHILVSQRVAEDLLAYRQWSTQLHDLGEAEVKHGVRVHVFNLCNEQLGNPEPPEMFRRGAALPSNEGFWVAVSPFKYSGSSDDLKALAEGLSDEIVTGLSRFSYLKVVSRAAGDGRDPGKRSGARYVLEGSLRQAGAKLRLAVQLVDMKTGAHLWAETYDRDLETSTIFAVQDDVASRIVATVADSYGILVNSMTEVAAAKDDADLTPAEWQFQYFAYRQQITPANHAALKQRLEAALRRDQRRAEIWSCLAQIYVDAYAFGFQAEPNDLDRALDAARRGVEFDRTNQFGLVSLAQTYFFRQDLAAFRPAAERAMALNPLNTDALGILGLLIVHTGEFERGAGIVRHAMALNPDHAGWMHFGPIWEHFHKREYELALDHANQVDIPGLFWPYLVVAAACGHLGRDAQARAAVRDLLAIDPEFAAHARSNIASWHFASGLLEPLLDGLRKAGLKIDGKTGAPVAEKSVDSVTLRGEEGFWVAVLPFKYAGPNAHLSALAEGLSEEIVTGLSRFSYLKVFARNAVPPEAGGSGKELGARYVLEGSLRQSGSRLRLAVQLVDRSSGAHLWAQSYERNFDPETVFDLQDELVPRIVSTVADQYGALVHSMSESLRGKSAGEFTAHEAVLRAFGYQERFTLEEHAEVRAILEAALACSPNHSDCLAELSCVYWHEYVFGYNPKPDSLGRAQAAARRAVETAPTSHFAHAALAYVSFFQKNFPAFRPAADRALALNPMDSSVMALLGTMIAYAGDWERGIGVVERAKELNPHHPGWYHYAVVYDAYRRGDYETAIANALKVNMPGYYWPHATLAAVYGQLGDARRAQAALRELDAIAPHFGEKARDLYGKWNDAEFTEHLLDGLRKAGLEIAEKKTISA